MKEQIIEVLSNKYDAQDIIAINDALNLNSAKELNELIKTIELLVAEHIIFKTKKEKYLLYKNCPNLKVGILSVNKTGNAFVIVEGGDVFVHQKNFNNATNGDEVLVETFIYEEKEEGKVIRILKRDTKNIIGTVTFKKNKPYLELDDEKKQITIELDESTTNNCVEGTKVLVNTIKEFPNNYYIGKVVKVIGHKNDPGVDIKSVAYKFGIFEEFSKETEEAINKIPVEVSPESKKGRKDLTNETIFTIDGDDTKDIDDAISIDYKNGIYKLAVHIADVSYYVEKDSPIDKDAYQRGTSSYLADSVIPMIPHKLSNGICSLNPKVERLAMSCEMEIDKEGNVINYDIFTSLIKSKIQMTYKKVNDYIMRDIVHEGYEPYLDKLKLMHELSHILRKAKVNRGYIDFELEEAKLIINEDGKCIDVQKRTREDAEKLIEDFMIVANETVATHIYNMKLPFIYRVHGNPKPEKIDNFIKLISLMGYKLVGKFKDLKPKSMQQILSQIHDKPEFSILSTLLLRSMQKAIYSSDNIGHFGLGSKCYTHFTSPIRRYPDLIVHRLLREFIVNANINNEVIEYWEKNLPTIAENTSEREQKSVEAEREVDDMKKAEYMENHIGEVHEGIISGVTSFGFFVELDNTVEGLVHVNSLTDDFYNYVPELMSLFGRGNKKRYRLGDKITIKLVAASKAQRMIDFEIFEKK